MAAPNPREKEKELRNALPRLRVVDMEEAPDTDADPILHAVSRNHEVIQEAAETCKTVGEVCNGPGPIRNRR